ncbi:MAG: hypothetical protein HY340_02930 [Candidatus Kerfeldbacteria bacterium]|nr:hypothetical protein [Candidatus Kerfeldbacteria bacterium]
MENPTEMSLQQPGAAFAIAPTGNESKEMGEKQILAVEIMNGIVFAVVLILFGIVWGTFASVTFAGA